MTRIETEVWEFLVLFSVTVAICCSAMVGCNATKTAAELSFDDQLTGCVTKSATRAEADACRAGVEARWTVDAGAEGGAR